MLECTWNAENVHPLALSLLSSWVCEMVSISVCKRVVYKQQHAFRISYWRGWFLWVAFVGEAFGLLCLCCVVSSTCFRTTNCSAAVLENFTQYWDGGLGVQRFVTNYKMQNVVDLFTEIVTILFSVMYTYQFYIVNSIVKRNGRRLFLGHLRKAPPLRCCCCCAAGIGVICSIEWTECCSGNLSCMFNMWIWISFNLQNNEDQNRTDDVKKNIAMLNPSCARF